MKHFLIGIIIGVLIAAGGFVFTPAGKAMLDATSPSLEAVLWTVAGTNEEVAFRPVYLPDTFAMEGNGGRDLFMGGFLFPATVVAGSGKRVEGLKTLVDTGSRTTFLDNKVIANLAPKSIGQTTVWSGPNGTQGTAEVYEVQIVLPTGVKVPVQVASADLVGEDILLGRDVLSRLRLVYDGPQNSASLSWAKMLPLQRASSIR